MDINLNMLEETLKDRIEESSMLQTMGLQRVERIYQLNNNICIFALLLYLYKSSLEGTN